jgi:hypothetical protein
MPAAKVFLSYCQADQQAVSELRPFLLPLARAGRVAWWDDSHLQLGDDWEGEIERVLEEAQVAVLILSQDFLNSDFIREVELPRILARARQERLRVIPVFWRASLAERTPIPFTDPATGGRKSTLLTRFQGFGSPGTLLKSLSPHLREQQFQRLAEELLALLGEAEP